MVGAFGVHGLHVNAADAGSAGPSDSEVASVAPRRAPRVLDEPVVLAVESSVSGNEHTVVERGTAALGKDTGSVVLEGCLVSLEGDRDGSQCDSG